MRRYGFRSVVVTTDDDGGPSVLTGETVMVPDDDPVNTGLVDAYERPIWRFGSSRPIGFDLSQRTVAMPKKKPKPMDPKMPPMKPGKPMKPMVKPGKKRGR